MESNQTGSDLGSWKAQISENVGTRRVTNSSGDWTSNLGLSIHQISNSSRDNYVQLIPSSVDAEACTYCRKLAVDILTRPPATICSGWEVLRSHYFTMKYLKEHHNGTVQTMRQSGSEGCQLCAFMAQQLKDAESDAKYHLFVWTQPPGNSEFRLALGDLSAYLEDISKWKARPTSFSFFRKNGSDSNWRYLSESRMFSHAEWPQLLALPNQFPGSDEALERAKLWLSDCIKNHPSCSRSHGLLPKRVLDLGSPPEVDKITLYETKGEVAPYVALSYSWGQSLPLKTTHDNIDEHRAGNFGTIPKTLRDAIFITRQLNIRYLWIDALCIIQGDKEDWAEQAAAMTGIYQGSALTISGLSSRDCNDGMLNVVSDPAIRIGTYYHPDDRGGQGDIFVGLQKQTLDLGEKHLSSRGWAFQERLVSVASLHFTDEGMVWECASKIALEHDQGYRRFKWKSDWESLMRKQSTSPNEDPYEFWNLWVSEFSKRELTYDSDKLPAMAGVAEAFANQFKITYMAGLWKENLRSGLLWQRHHTIKTLTRPSCYVAPSWSWASVKGYLKYPNHKLSSPRKGYDTFNLRVKVQEEMPLSFGSISHGIIEGEGFLQTVIIDRSLHPGVRKKSYQECTIVNGISGNAVITCMLDEFDESSVSRFTCWCLRVGTFDAHGRETTVFMLLKKTESEENVFERIGVAETNPWDDKAGLEPATFISPQRLEFRLI